MAPHSSTLSGKIPWTEEPGGLQSPGLLRVGHDWATSLSLSTFMHWRRKWQPTPEFLPGESQGRGSLVGCRWPRLKPLSSSSSYVYIYTHIHLCVCVCVCIHSWNWKNESESHSVVSSSFWPYGLHSPWTSPGQNTGVGSRSLLQGIFLTQGSNPGLPHCR